MINNSVDLKKMDCNFQLHPEGAPKAQKLSNSQTRQENFDGGGGGWYVPLNQNCKTAESYLCRNSYTIFPPVWIHLWAAQLGDLGSVCL